MGYPKKHRGRRKMGSKKSRARKKNKKNQRRLWDTQKNIEVVGKWALKKDEQERKIRKNRKNKLNA